jgi:hypothetical protein
MIVATGVSYWRLELSALDSLVGRGVLYQCISGSRLVWPTVKFAEEQRSSLTHT